ncbi:MAG: hypothetical protein WBE78_02660 [Candidatus Binataceae bacterium]
MRSRHYLGNRFEIWNGERAWYWLVDSPNHGIGSIGVAATESDAVGEACAAIDEISAVDNASNPDWMAALQNLERYLACANQASA